MGNPKTFILSLLLATIGAGFITPGFAEAPAEIPADSSKVISVEAYPSLKPIPLSESFELAIRIKIKEGWHINGHEGLPEGFVPLQVSLLPSQRFEISGPPKFAPGVLKAIGGSEKPFPVYEKETLVILPIKVKDKAKFKEGSVAILLEVRVQACDDKVCLRPAAAKFNTEVSLPLNNEVTQPINQEFFKISDNITKEDKTPTDNIIYRFLLEKGVLVTFLLIFLGGLALNLTPCVYPMIPITVSYFGSQKDEKPLVILGRATAYVVGISLTYSTLGVTAALTGKILGSTLQSPTVLIGISSLLVILSLSMFGLYELQAPRWLLDKVAAGNTKGWIGALGMGLVFGIVAAPCVDPFSIGLLTYVAAKANPFLGFIMFFTLSLGLGFPYLWLGFFSSNLQKLPRSGMWMVWVKKVFGMILLGMPLYFLNPMMPKDFNHIAVPVYLILSGILLGWVFTENKTGIYWLVSLFHPSHYFKKFQHAFGVFLILAGFLTYRAWPQPAEITFQAYNANLLQQAAKEKKPVFIDFTASWCLPCKELEIKTFSDSRVQEAFKGWLLLKADLSQYDSGPVEELKKTYEIMGVPTLVFVGADGAERKNLRAIGFIPPEDLVQKITSISK